MNQQQYWDNMAKHGENASVIDPSDRKGYKNQYIIELRNNAIISALSQPEGASILDFGCGTGNLSEFLYKQGFQITGVDISNELLELAKSRQSKTSEWDTFLYDGKKLPFNDNSFDAITTYVVLNHILDDNQLNTTLKELHRILRPGGQLIAIEQIRRKVTVSADESKKQRPLTDFIQRFQYSGLSVDNYKIIRRGHFLPIYVIRLGLVPKFLFKFISKIELFIGSTIKAPLLDYADVIFSIKKMKND